MPVFTSNWEIYKSIPKNKKHSEALSEETKLRLELIEKAFR